MAVTMMKKGYAKLQRSHTSTGLMLGVLGREEDTDKYTEVRTIMQVMFTVISSS